MHYYHGIYHRHGEILMVVAYTEMIMINADMIAVFIMCFSGTINYNTIQYKHLCIAKCSTVESNLRFRQSSSGQTEVVILCGG